MIEAQLFCNKLSQGPGKRRTHQTPQARRDSTPPTLLLQSFITLLTTVRFASNFDMSSIRESHIQHAIQDLTVGRFESIRATAKAYNLVESTLRRRYQNKSVSYSVARETTRLLSSWQEELLIHWINNSEACGHSVNYPQLREFVTLLVTSSGSDKKCGHNWVARFLQRRPEVKSKIGKKIDTLRVKNTSPEVLSPWFDRLYAIIQKLGVTPANMWNIDETGIALGVCTNQRVIGSSETTHTYIQTPENREWVSIIECISASGLKITPVVIFKGKTLQSTWFTPGKTPEYHYTCSEKGWTSNDIGIRWLKHVFLPSTNPGVDIPQLLILDGHGSHVSIEFMRICWESNVFLYYLIPHSSHVLQPLDLSCFSVLKSRYRNQILALSSLSDSAPIKKSTFLEVYHKARTEGLTEHNVRAGWRASGIVPWNPQKVLRSSQVKRIEMTVPKTPASQRIAPNLVAIRTPANRRDLQDQFQRLAATEEVSRSVRLLVQKASKTIDSYTFDSARMNCLIVSQESQLSHLKNKRKKKIAIDVNEQFANIEDIVRVQEEIERRRDEFDRKDRAKEARQTADMLVRQGMTSLLHQFHVADSVDVETATSTL